MENYYKSKAFPRMKAVFLHFDKMIDKISGFKEIQALTSFLYGDYN